MYAGGRGLGFRETFDISQLFPTTGMPAAGPSTMTDEEVAAAQDQARRELATIGTAADVFRPAAAAAPFDPSTWFAKNKTGLAIGGAAFFLFVLSRGGKR